MTPAGKIAETEHALLGAAVLIGLAIVGGVIYAVAAADHGQAPDKAALKIAKQMVAVRLRDPGSAEFSMLSVHQVGPRRVVCGWVNAKNGFGGYAGPERFVAGMDALPLLSGVDDEAGFEAAWRAGGCTP
jgi:hypothetical protein